MDAVTLSVVRGGLDQVANEMDLHFIRSAISPIISEMKDCASGIFHPATGEMIAQGQFGLPMFMANMQVAISRMIPLIANAGGLKEGDVWFVNDPYIAGTHLSDIIMVAPYFRDGSLVALLASMGHWMDIGGAAAGGLAPNASDIHQEGIRIPPMKLIDRGKMNDLVLNLVLANLRLPSEVRGDIAAMLSVFDVGRRRLDLIYGRYGAKEMADGIAEMMVRSENQMRTYISEIPEGEYRFEHFIDNDGHVDQALKLALTVRVKNSEFEFDFTGTAVAPKGPLNLPDATTMSACYVALKHLFPEVPINGGTFRAARFKIPKGTLVAAEYPKPVGGYLEIVSSVMNVVFGALAPVLPERTPAEWFGTAGALIFGGTHPETGRYFVSAWIYPGGYGASRQSDGLVHGTSALSTAQIMSFELSERRAPIRFERVNIREDSGGAGWHSGGCGSTYEISAWSDCVLSVLGDRVDHPPSGVFGGRPAAGNEVVLRTGGRKWIPPMRSKYENLLLHPGDSVCASSPGGGGFGDPLDRAIEAVERDLNLGYISTKTATEVHGVVIARTSELGDRFRYELDRDATLHNRASLKNSKVGSVSHRLPLADSKRRVRSKTPATTFQNT
jgi:N-methylhydantoinase B